MTADQTLPPLTFAFFPDVPLFAVRSDDVADGEKLSNCQVATSMGYHGDNLSPHLAWSGFPAETKSFAVTIHDPDAPTGSGFWHWAVFNIPASTTELVSGASAGLLPEGAIEVKNDAGFMGFMGAAPPPGDRPHRYVHTVHALDVATLDIDESVSPALVGFNARFHGIARAQIVPIFFS